MASSIGGGGGGGADDSFLLGLASKYQISSLDASDLHALGGDISSADDGDSSFGLADASISSLEASSAAEEDDDGGAAGAGGGDESKLAAPRQRPRSKAGAAAAARRRKAAEAQHAEELRRKDAMIADLRALHEKEQQLVSELREQAAAAERARGEAQAKLERVVAGVAHEVKRREAATAKELEALRERLHQVEEQSPGLQQQRQLKESLQDVAITESVYLKYKAKGERAQSLREFVTVRVYELLLVERQAREAAAMEADRLREQKVAADAKLARVERHARVAEQTLRDEVRALRQANETLTKRLEESRAAVVGLTAKGEEYDRVRERATELEAANAELTKQNTMNAFSLRSATEERDDMAKQFSTQGQQLDLLRMDKMYLEKQVDALTDKCAAAAAEQERLRNKVADVKRARDELVDKLVQVRDEHKEHYEKKLEGDLEQLRARMHEDLQLIRVNQKEAYEREVAGLRTARDDAVAQLQRERLRLEGVEAHHTQLVEDHRKLLSESEITATKLRSALKLKAFELERLQVAHDEQTGEHRRNKIELKTALEKIKIIRSEHDELQTAADRAEARLSAERDALRERLALYESLERELDHAILESTDNDDDDVNGGDGDEAKKAKKKKGSSASLLAAFGSSLPTSNQRRVQQSILLARQLMSKQRELAEARKTLAERDARVSELEGQLARCRAQLGRVQQPYALLVTDIEAKEKEAQRARATAEQREADVQRLTKRLEEALHTEQRLRADLARLVAREKEVQDLREMLVRFQQQAPAAGRHQQHTSTYTQQQQQQQRKAVPAWYKKLTATTQ